jgi:hypothetical protein
MRLCARLGSEGIFTKGIVLRITDSGRTISYRYTTDSGSFQGKTMSLPIKLVCQYKEKDQISVLYDRAIPKELYYIEFESYLKSYIQHP